MDDWGSNRQVVGDGALFSGFLVLDMDIPSDKYNELSILVAFRKGVRFLPDYP